MSCDISEALRTLAAEYDHATTQKERDRLRREIARVSRKEERDREGARQRRTGQGWFEASMLSLDRLVDTFEDPSKAAAFSDGGAGAERIVSACDGNGGAARSAQCIRTARRRIRRTHPEWLEVFDLIVKNGSNRTESICQMTRSKR